jgi:hypothetical protein
MFYCGNVGFPRRFFGPIKIVPDRGGKNFTLWLTETLTSPPKQTITCFPFLAAGEMSRVKQTVCRCIMYVMSPSSSSLSIASASSNSSSSEKTISDSMVPWW